jgi:5'-3' exonuclease
MANQMGRLIEYCTQLPVSMISIPKIEADDVMGYLVKKFEADPKTDKVTIMSADKDFMQLISNKTEIYSPTKKKTYGEREVLEEYFVHPNNFINYKMLLGDSGDNVPGIQGLGPKKVFKLYPELMESNPIDLEYMLNKAKLNESENALYTKILSFANQLNINFKLMSLKDPNISNEDKRIIDETVEDAPPSLNIGSFVEMTENDQLNERIDWQGWLIENFSSLDWKQ